MRTPKVAGIAIFALVVAGPAAAAPRADALPSPGAPGVAADDPDGPPDDPGPQAASSGGAEAAAETPGAGVVPVATAAATQAARGRDWWFGLRGGAYLDVEEPFLGAELLFPLSDRFYFNPNVEFVLVDAANLVTFNGDFHYDLPTEGRLLVWLGAGLAGVWLDPDGPLDSDTDLGGNFFAGLGANQGTWIPYVQAKLLVTEDDNEIVLAGGVRF